MDASHADIVNGIHLVAHHLGGDLRFFGHRHIAGAGADHGDPALAVNRAVAPEADRAGKRKVFGAGKCGFDGRRAARGPRA